MIRSYLFAIFYLSFNISFWFILYRLSSLFPFPFSFLILICALVLVLKINDFLFVFYKERIKK